MKYRITIFFDNPVTRWQYSNCRELPVLESDILLRRTFRWRFVAEAFARGICTRTRHTLWRVDAVDR